MFRFCGTKILSSVLSAVCVTSLGIGCKPRSKSGLKTLDNFAAGSRVTINTCAGGPELEGKPEVRRRVDAVMRQVRPSMESLSPEISESFFKGISAIPIAQLDAFLTLKGEIHIVNDPNQVCTAQLKQISNQQQKNSKDTELKAFKEGMADVDHCYVYYPTLYQDTKKIPPPILVIKNDLVVVKHSIVRVFGYFLSSHLTHIEFTKDGFTYHPQENTAFRDTFKRPLSQAFLKDIETLHKDRVAAFAAYQHPEKLAAGDREQFEDFIFAEAFDSFHCNAFADDERLNTLYIMMKQFPSTYNQFKNVYTPQTAVSYPASAKSSAASTTKSNGGFSLQGDDDGGWWGSIKSFGSGYSHFFAENAATAYRATTAAVGNTATAVSNTYSGYSDGLKAKTQNAIDGIANSNNGRIGMTDYAKAVVSSTAGYNAENVKDAYGNYSERVKNTTQGVIDVAESNKGTGNLTALDYTSAVLYSTSRQGLSTLSSTVNTSEKLAEAIGGGTYNLDEKGRVTGTEALTVDQRMGRVKTAAMDAGRDVLIGEAFMAGSKMKIMGEADDVAKGLGKAGTEAAEGAGTATKGVGTVAAEAGDVLCLGPCEIGGRLDMSKLARSEEGGYKVTLNNGKEQAKIYSRDEVAAISSGKASIRGSDGNVVWNAPAPLKNGPNDALNNNMTDAWNGTDVRNLDDATFSLSEQSLRARNNLKKSGQEFSDSSWKRFDDSVAEKAKETLSANGAHKFSEDSYEQMLSHTTGGRISYSSTSLSKPKVSDEFKSGQWFDHEGPNAKYRDGNTDSGIFDQSKAKPLFNSAVAPK